MRHLPSPAQVYIWTVSIAGATVLGIFFPTVLNTNLSDDLRVAGLCFAALLLTETHQIPVSYRTSVTVSTAVIFASFLLVGAPLTAWATAAALSGAYIHLGRRWYNVMFNVAAYTLTIALTGLIYRTAGLPDRALFSYTNLVAMAVAATTYFVTNTGLVAGVIGLRERRSTWNIWMSIFEEAAPEYLTMILLGVLTALVYQQAWWALVLVVFPIVIVYHALQASQELRVQTIEAVQALADAIDSRDPYTFDHSRRVAGYAEGVARELGLPAEEIETISLSARVHDLGKIGIRDDLLYKPGQLTTEERLKFRQHVRIGAEIVQRFPRYKEGCDTILYHHERYDGNGYLEGLRGDDIPIGARIIAVCDAYDAMTTDRPYRRALPQVVAIDELKRHSGSQFDPIVVGAFLKYLDGVKTRSYRMSAIISDQQMSSS